MERNQKIKSDRVQNTEGLLPKNQGKEVVKNKGIDSQQSKIKARTPSHSSNLKNRTSMLTSTDVNKEKMEILLAPFLEGVSINDEVYIRDIIIMKMILAFKALAVAAAKAHFSNKNIARRGTQSRGMHSKKIQAPQPEYNIVDCRKLCIAVLMEFNMRLGKDPFDDMMTTI
jgi:hypothetical protein